MFPIDKYNLQEQYNIHKRFMSSYFENYNRFPFNKDGYTQCPVINKEINISDVLDNDRCNPNSIQLGHIEPRNNYSFTIRGLNILIMTRTGNRLVGEYNFLEDEWAYKIIDAIPDNVLKDMCKQRNISIE